MHQHGVGSEGEEGCREAGQWWESSGRGAGRWSRGSSGGGAQAGVQGGRAGAAVVEGAQAGVQGGRAGAAVEGELKQGCREAGRD